MHALPQGILLQGLPTDSAHVASGSTFSTLRAITLFKVPRDAPDVPADDPFLSGLLQLVNAWIKGALSPATMDLLNLSRAAFVPKGENEARCIGVGDAIYRVAARCALKKVTPSAGRVLNGRQLAV